MYSTANLTCRYGGCSEVIDRYQRAAWVYSNRGHAYLNKGELDPAIADTTKAIEIAPTFAPDYANRAAAYGSKGDSDQAIADATRAIEIAPGFAPAYVNRAAAFNNKGDGDRAMAEASKAIEIAPTLAPAYVGVVLARMTVENDRHDSDPRKACMQDATVASPLATVIVSEETFDSDT